MPHFHASTTSSLLAPEPQMSGVPAYSAGKKRYDPSHPLIEIGTAWLALSHGAWVGASVACFSISMALVSLFGSGVLHDPIKSMALGWAALGLFVAVWTIYAIGITWRTSKMVEGAIFDDFGFTFLLLVGMATLGIGVWTIVVVARA